MSTSMFRSPSLQASDRDKKVHLHFRVSYLTKWGQHLIVTGTGALLGNFSLARAVRMRCHHEKEGLVWEALVALPWQPHYKYKYAVVHYEDGQVQADRYETIERSVELPPGLQNGDIVELLDTWSDRSHPSSLLATAAFTRAIRASKRMHTAGTPIRVAPAVAEAVVRFQISDWQMDDGDTLCISGSMPLLGTWQLEEMVDMTEVNTPMWEVEVRVPYNAFPFTYKYAVRAEEGDVLMESGDPRIAALPLAGSSHMGAPAVVVHHDGHFRREKLWRGAGVAVPVFSLRTENSVGVGEFIDLKQLVDFAQACGLHLIQILPVNDTSVYKMWWDSYPYSTLSVFALHPLYLSLRALRSELPVDLEARIQEAKQELDVKPEVDYEKTLAAKLSIARAVFDRFGAETVASTSYKEWFAENEPWLRPYAAFCFLRDLFGSSEHWRWGDLSNPTAEVLQRITGQGTEYYASIECCCWIQYHLHRQLLEASQYASAQGVALKGDIPIGVDKRSVDTWVQPELFRMQKQTGAPPDAFDPNGQNWGFPTYNWEVMSTDGYSWWRKRLAHMAQYFHAYRIDHILGFFRIWEIPEGCSTGILGHFHPAVPLFQHELEKRGLWDLDRLARPYIRQHLLDSIFGSLAPEVAAKYLKQDPTGVFHLRPPYDKETAISAITVREDAPDWLKEEVATVRRGLLQLRQNVLLLQDSEDPKRFYPRFQLTQSNSYKELDKEWRDQLAQLYDEFYTTRHDDVWMAQALRTLPVLMGATDMLVCGEDLGFVPHCVQPIMQELGLIALRIQRMPVEPDSEFNNPAGYSYLTVASPSCHDVAPMRAWYEDDAERRERFYYTMLAGAGEPPPDCSPEILRVVVQQHLNCPSVWAIFPIQDLMALSERYTDRPSAEEVINDPTTSKHYWRFRLRPTLEQLAGDSELTGQLRDLLLVSERCRLEELPPGQRLPSSVAAAAAAASYTSEPLHVPSVAAKSVMAAHQAKLPHIPRPLPSRGSSPLPTSPSPLSQPSPRSS